MNAQPAASHLSPLRRALAATVLGALGALAAAAHAQANPRADQVRSMNAQVLQLQSELRRSGAANGRAAQVLAARAAALRELMATDPTAAEKLAFPATVLEQLAASFPEQAASLEERGHWEGELDYRIEDGSELRTHRSIIKLRSGDELLDLGFAGGEPPGLVSGHKLAVKGVRSGRSLVATEVEVTRAAQDGGTSTTTSTTAPYPATCSKTGPQGVLAILVNLPSYKLSIGMTHDFVRGVLLGNAHAGASQNSPDYSVNDFWMQNSDGKTFIDPTNTTVVGPVELGSDYNTDANGGSFCADEAMLTAARAAVDSQVDFRRYSRIQLIFPSNGACSYAGIATLGCRGMSSSQDGSFVASIAWQKSGSMGTRARGVQLTTHEMGHNLSMHHSSSRRFTSEPLGALGSAGTLSEYGDMHATMGSWNFGFYSASHAANQLGWLGLGSNYQVVEGSGTYTIQNYEDRPAGIKALKVRRGTGNEAWLWIESRQSTGIYSSTLNSSLFGGALIHYQDSTTGTKSHLLDFTPATSSFSDAPLPLGQTWTDPYSNVAVTVTGVTPSALTVAVNYGAVPCTRAAPTVTASPTGTATEYGSAATFNVTVKNNDSGTCNPQSFTLGATAPSGWSKAFGAAALTVAPGQTATTTLALGVPAPYALGTYEIAASASATSGNGLAKQNVTVVEPVHRLSLAISGSGSVAFSSPAKTCTNSCTTDYLEAQAPTITLTATAGNRTTFAGWSGACSGTASTCTVSMNAEKSVTATFGKSSGGKPRR